MTGTDEVLVTGTVRMVWSGSFSTTGTGTTSRAAG